MLCGCVPVPTSCNFCWRNISEGSWRAYPWVGHRHRKVPPKLSWVHWLQPAAIFVPQRWRNIFQTTMHFKVGTNKNIVVSPPLQSWIFEVQFTDTKLIQHFVATYIYFNEVVASELPVLWFWNSFACNENDMIKRTLALHGFWKAGDRDNTCWTMRRSNRIVLESWRRSVIAFGGAQNATDGWGRLWGMSSLISFNVFDLLANSTPLCWL